jgi:hypothetical protein
VVYEKISMGHGTLDAGTGLLTCEASIYHEIYHMTNSEWTGRKEYKTVEELDIKIKVTSATDEEMQKLEMENGGSLELENNSKGSLHGSWEDLYQKAREQIPELAQYWANYYAIRPRRQ